MSIILFDNIRNHIENWKIQCGYNIPYDYVGLKDIINKPNDLYELKELIRSLGAKPDSEIEKKICEYVNNNFTKKK